MAVGPFDGTSNEKPFSRAQRRVIGPSTFGVTYLFAKTHREALWAPAGHGFMHSSN